MLKCIHSFALMIYRYILFLCFSLFFVSCEKEITIDLPQEESKIVVEGFIENGQVPFLMLTKTSPYFEAFDSNTLDNMFVHGANITVSDGTTTLPMVEYCCENLPDSLKAILLQFLGVGGLQCPYNICVYTTLPDFTLIGTPGKTYTLNVNVNGENLHSSSYMPYPPAIDSLWVEYRVYDSDSNAQWVSNPSSSTDSICRWVGRFTDQQPVGDFYMYHTKRNDEPFIYGGVFDDKFVNGTTFDLPIFRAQARGSEFDEKTSGLFQRGDTMYIRRCTIDFQTYKFFNTLDYEQGNQGSIFSSPTIIQTNIDGGLGIWYAYSATYRSQIAQ